MHVAPRILSNFVTLFVAIGLVETAVAFANSTAGLTAVSAAAWLCVR